MTEKPEGNFDSPKLTVNPLKIRHVSANLCRFIFKPKARSPGTLPHDPRRGNVRSPVNARDATLTLPYPRVLGSHMRVGTGARRGTYLENGRPFDNTRKPLVPMQSNRRRELALSDRTAAIPRHRCVRSHSHRIRLSSIHASRPSSFKRLSPGTSSASSESRTSRESTLPPNTLPPAGNPCDTILSMM